MRLVYEDSGVEVKTGDVRKLRDGAEVTVDYFYRPTSPASEGKIHFKERGGEYYVSLIGAHWIEREDREGDPS